jgi:hypothetical protein
VRNTARLYRFMFILGIFALPLGWIWLRQRAAWLRWACAVALAAALFGGLTLLGAALPVVQQPMTTYFLDGLDAQMSSRYWNNLDPGALVFDPIPVRAPTVLGRATDSSVSWYENKPGWSALNEQPVPAALRSAGFDYAYLDMRYFDSLPPQVRQTWEGSCARLVGEASRSDNWRRLYDLRGCQ